MDKCCPILFFFTHSHAGENPEEKTAKRPASDHELVETTSFIFEENHILIDRDFENIKNK